MVPGIAATPRTAMNLILGTENMALAPQGEWDLATRPRADRSAIAPMEEIRTSAGIRIPILGRTSMARVPREVLGMEIRVPTTMTVIVRQEVCLERGFQTTVERAADMGLIQTRHLAR